MTKVKLCLEVIIQEYYSLSIEKINKIKIINKSMQLADKAAKKAAAEVSAGYELTIGMTTPDFCTNFLAPNLPDPKRLCVTQV